MSDDKNRNFGFGGGFLGDALKDLQSEYSSEIASRNKKKSPKAKTNTKPASKKREPVTAIPAEHIADYHPGDMVLDTYRVQSEAIRGGMGAVWRVTHTGWNMDLAMKRPKAEAFQTPHQKDNFTAECRHWINLGLHPNIVSCYYVREVEKVPTIFSEWMENGSLESHIKNGTLYKGTEKEVQERLLDIAVQFARGLHYAHENHLIHQDVKPDNVLLGGDWTAKVSDFGLARARTNLTFLEGDATEPDYDSDRTFVSPSGGRTPAYCSPEQAAAQLLTRRTDIYSWGVSIMEMYLGRKPWAHSGQLTGPLAGLACRDYFEMCTEHPIPEALQELLAHCMEHDPDLRPDDFSIVESELLKIYRSITGISYSRPEPKAAPDTPDSLNNKALSYLDLNLKEEAMNCWKAANDKDPTHAASIYNIALHMWRSGEIDDLTAIRLVRSDLVDKDHRYLAARIELERGNGEFDREGADECDLEAAELLPSLDEQTYALKRFYLTEKPCLEVSPDEDLILAGGHGASLFSLKDKKSVWTNVNIELVKGSAVNWEKGEICSTRRPANDQKGLQGIAVDRTLYFYRLNNGRLKGKAEINGYPEACTYKNDRQLYVTASHLRQSQYSVRLLDLSTQQPLKERSIHKQDFTFGEKIDVLFNNDGSLILSYWRPKQQGEITYYDAENWEPVNSLFLDGEAVSLHSGETNDRIWCLSRNIYTCDFKTGSLQMRYKAPDPIADFNICGKYIVAATKNDCLQFIEPGTGRIIRSIPLPGSCYSDSIRIGKNTVYLLLSDNDLDHDEIYTVSIPKFGFRAAWELCKIQTSSRRLELEHRFSMILLEAEEALQNNDLRKAELLAAQAMGLDPSMQNDPRAKSLLHTIQSKKIKIKLNRAVLVRAVSADAGRLSFSEDSGELLIIEKNDTGSVVNLDTGEMLYGLSKERCLPPSYHREKKKRELVGSMLPSKYGKVRLAFDASEDGKNAAAIDIKTMGTPPQCTLRLYSKETNPAEWSTDLDLFYTTDDTLHFLSDGRTLLMTRRMAKISTNLVVRFSFWNVPEHKLLREFDIMGGPLVNYFKFFVAPDEKGALIEYQIPDGPRDSLPEKIKYENWYVDFKTGRKTKALGKEPKELKIHYGIKLSNKLRFSGVGRQIVYIKDPYTVALTPLQPREKETEAVNDFNIPADFAVSPDGLFLAVAGGEGKNTVYIYKLEWDLQYPEVRK